MEGRILDPLTALRVALVAFVLAWILVRYEFPGRRFIDAIVDFPFALPTAVAGLTLANLFAANGWLGKYLVPLSPPLRIATEID